jgi:hypothetical protein
VGGGNYDESLSSGELDTGPAGQHAFCAPDWSLDSALTGRGPARVVLPFGTSHRSIAAPDHTANTRYKACGIQHTGSVDHTSQKIRQSDTYPRPKACIRCQRGVVSSSRSAHADDRARGAGGQPMYAPRPVFPCPSLPPLPILTQPHDRTTHAKAAGYDSYRIFAG